ncbi:diguanylate cyclase domain-containing protein [Jannaschia sp. R86511]|uniref:diguanylate cyclase domain-containing protein n=1 Tax=Jannaschia sp. R86511 TaxID=3093853 RepID=UPI0036D32D1F
MADRDAAGEVLLVLGEELTRSGRAARVVDDVAGWTGAPPPVRVVAVAQLGHRLAGPGPLVVVLDLAAPGARSTALLDALRRRPATTGLVLLPPDGAADPDDPVPGLLADDVVLRDELATRHLARAVGATRRQVRAAAEHRRLQERLATVSAASALGLAEAEKGARFQAALLGGISQAVVVTDPQARVVFWNAAAERLYGWSAEEAVGRPVLEVTPRADVDAQVSDIDRAVRSGQAWGGDEVMRRRDGSEFQALVSVAPVYDEQDGLVALVGVSSDITARKQAEQRARTLSAIVESMADAVLTHDLAGVVLTWNAGAERLFGWDAEEAVGTHLRGLFAGDQAPGELEVGIGIVASGEVIREHEMQGRRRDGHRVDLTLTASPVLDERGAVVAASVIARDVSERLRLQAELHHQATHDALTGLPNRALLEDRLAQTLAAAARTGHPVGVLFVDLDDFKTVNDEHGHLVGDALLREVARRFTAVTRPADTVARFGGDEFVVVCDDTDVADAQLVAARIAEACRPVVEVGDRRLQVSASIGIAVGPPLEADGALLVRCADAALYRAKADGRACWHVYGSERSTRPARLS